MSDVKKAATPKDPFKQLGGVSLHHSSGFVYEEFLKELLGNRGRKTFQEMRDNDPTIGGVMAAIEQTLRKVKWCAEPAEGFAGTEEGDGAAEFVDSLFEDMSHTYSDFISEALTMCTFGWSFGEVVYKRRSGITPGDPGASSKFDDGAIGLRKIVFMAQNTLDRWEIDPQGGIRGMHQTPPMGGHASYVPIEKALLFRTTTAKNNPEGRSLLRNAYRPWYYLKNLQNIEAIAIERELAGLPVVRIPQSVFNDTEQAAVLETYKKIARDLKFNEQGALLIPSDTFIDKDGKMTDIQKVQIELLTSGGRRTIDTSVTIERYQRDIARTVLADFIMLGSTNAGSFALSKSKTELFLQSLEYLLDMIASVINRHLLPKVWLMNGFDPKFLPCWKPGKVANADLEELGKYITALSGAGIILGGDEDTERMLREEAGLPGERKDDLAFDAYSPELDNPGEGGEELEDGEETGLEEKRSLKDWRT